MPKHLTYKPIEVLELWQRCHHPHSGGIVLFSGEVRDNHLGKSVDSLEYEAIESMAEKMIAETLREATQRWNLQHASAIHRLGTVHVMETAVVVITTSAHRKEAYEANQYIIHKLKHEVPIWKCEVFVDGSRAWGGHCNCNLAGK